MTGCAVSLLLVCADPSLSALARTALPPPRFHLAVAEDSEQAYALLRGVAFDAALLAWDPPALGSLRLLEHIKATSRMPACILLPTPDPGIVDCIATKGAHDCLAATMPAAQLGYRIQRLVHRPSDAAAEFHEFGSLTLNPTTLVARWKDREIALGRIEFRLLDLFLRHHGEALPRSFIFHAVWPDSGYEIGRLVDVHVSNLRRALLRDAQIRPLQTVRGIGYRLRIRTT